MKTKQLVLLVLCLCLLLPSCARVEPGTELPAVTTEPIETKPLETKPLETEPLETEPIETEPIETEPMETQPTEEAPEDDGLEAYLMPEMFTANIDAWSKNGLSDFMTEDQIAVFCTAMNYMRLNLVPDDYVKQEQKIIIVDQDGNIIEYEASPDMTEEERWASLCAKTKIRFSSFENTMRGLFSDELYQMMMEYWTGNKYLIKDEENGSLRVFEGIIGAGGWMNVLRVFRFEKSEESTENELVIRITRTLDFDPNNPGDFIPPYDKEIHEEDHFTCRMTLTERGWVVSQYTDVFR